MNVPLLDLQSQLTGLRDEILESVTRVIDSTRYIQGPEVEALEQEIAQYCDAAHAIGVSSGTDALLASVMALNIGHGDLVLTTPFSFFATMGVILRVGARPIFADIDPTSYNIDPDNIEAILTADRNRRIKAIIPVHLYGQCADMERILKIADRFAVPVLEDAAQAIGAVCPINQKNGLVWKKAGTIGTTGSFSFFPSKNLGGIGDGGMIVTQNDTMANTIRLLRNHGAHPKYYHALVGGNFRLDPIQATVLRIKLRHLETWHEERRINAQRYTKLFREAGFSPGDSRVVTPAAVYSEMAGGAEEGRNYHIYNQYVIRVEQREQLREWLQKKNVGTEIYYPLGLHQQKCLVNNSEIPPMKHAEQAAKQVLALPIYPGLTEAMQEYVVESIQSFYK